MADSAPPTPEPKGREAGFAVDEEGWVVGAYLVGDPMAEEAVCIAADAAGWRAPGVRRFARKLATRGGALVVIPDLHRGDTWYGDPAPVARAGADFDSWAAAHPAERVASDIAFVIAALRERGAKRVSVVGMGWGARAVISLLLSSLEASGAAACGGGVDEERGDNASSANTVDAAAVVCALGVDASAVAAAAKAVARAKKAPLVFVWGGGDAAAAATACEVVATKEGAPGLGVGLSWVTSRTFPQQSEDFAFAPSQCEGDEDEECVDEAAAAKLVLDCCTFGGSVKR
mmetsp:Transcript_37958/g.94051  ORF Transcript_37958/g.94051 Transcript_37958/m.94051 type:complete len:288 (+) Transcript_37958:1366-2229(+)